MYAIHVLEYRPDRMNSSEPHIDVTLQGPVLLVLAGAAGAGKSTLARRFFSETQIVSTDRCRALVGDREDLQAVSKQAFELFYFLIEKRMELRRLVVADSTALSTSARSRLLKLARDHYYFAVLIVLSADLATRRDRNQTRDRRVADEVLVKQQEALDAALPGLKDEGWDEVYVLKPDEVERLRIHLEPPGVRCRVPPPYDIIGDVHGCFQELTELLDRLGWQREGELYAHPQGRTLVSLGDLADRGPDVANCFRLFTGMVHAGRALFVPGNHDNKLLRYLIGRNVKVAHGLEGTIEQLSSIPEPEQSRLRRDIVELTAKAPPYLLLDRDRLAVAHAGIRKEMLGKVSRRIIDFTLYGDVTGRTTPDGLPVRLDWAGEYRGTTFVVYGHTPMPDAVIRNNTVNIDQGCVFGGALTALRYPEMELLQVPARRVYYQRPGGGLDVDSPAE